ncbi:MAG: hypothetical protein M1838_000695 [Thelocarpon superellum]|nr:MAG: hypothetical protein M1838_000695 [Thelocarpon superellum]
MAPHATKRRKVHEDRMDGETARSAATSDESAANEEMVDELLQTRRSTAARRQSRKGPSLDMNQSIFNLQINELLDDIRPDYEKRRKTLEPVLRRLKSTIEDIPPHDERTVSEAEKVLQATHGIRIPFPTPRPSKDVKWRLSYAKPSEIHVIGSHTLKLATKVDGAWSVDLAVTMPSALFQDKDYLNRRYFHKRAYYLACLAAGIHDGMEQRVSMTFDGLHGNVLQPVLVLAPVENAKVKIRVLPIVRDGVFAPSKTAPWCNCVRPAGPPSTDPSSLQPTPFYNASLRLDGAAIAYLKFLHSTASHCASYADACLLGRVWLRQRGLTSTMTGGGFGHFEWATLMALLLRGGGRHGRAVLSPGYSSYQLFKATLQLIATRDLTREPLVFQGGDHSVPSTALPQVYDGPRGMNILFRMSRWSYDMLRHEAKVSLKMLGDAVEDPFDAAFLVKEHEPLQKFDCVTRLTVPTVPKPESSALDHEVRAVTMCKDIHWALTTGLGDRVELVHLGRRESVPWSIQSASSESRVDLIIGFMVHPVNASRLVDHGPPAEDKEAAASFQSFWGEKAELRRFKDGSIVESLVWSDSDASRPVFEQVIRSIVGRHVGPAVEQTLQFCGPAFDHLLAGEVVSGAKPLAPFQATMTEFEGLERAIRALEGLPLQLRQISKADATLRYASVFYPGFTSRQAPSSVILQFEGSGRWPDDLVAIQRTKIAFLLKAGDLLEEAIEDCSARVGLENEQQPLMNAAFLDMILPSGAAFRLRIHHEREQVLLEKDMRNKTLEARRREEAVSGLARYKREFVQSIQHTQAIGMLCTRHPFLSPTMRLMKQWAGAHLLSRHLSDEFLELLVAHTFLQPYPWCAPSSIMTGFLRTLQFVARWDWRMEPLMVNLGGELTAQTAQSIRLRFDGWRKIDPSMQRTVVFAASDLDPDGVTWTQPRPSKVIATRLTSLARAACAYVKEAQTDLVPRTLFDPTMTDYDFVIHLSPAFTDQASRSKSTSARQFKNLQQARPDPEMIGFDPIDLFLTELEEGGGRP